jgi:hypothetical protein
MNTRKPHKCAEHLKFNWATGLYHCTICKNIAFDDTDNQWYEYKNGERITINNPPH